MKIFTIYTVATGEIVCSGFVANDDDLARQVLDPGQAVLEGVQGWSDRQIVTGGALVDRPAAPVAKVMSVAAPAAALASPAITADELYAALETKGILTPADIASQAVPPTA